MYEHKIQSSDGLQMNLKQVPKMLLQLTNTWAKECYVVSFKLETDPDLVVQKSKAAIEKYSVHLVVANQLQVHLCNHIFLISSFLYFFYFSFV
jgi:phosphopantothenate---cysteine ligase (ATP)